MCITLLVIIKIITLLVKSLSLDFRIRFITSVYRGLRISRRFLKICSLILTYYSYACPAHICPHRWDVLWWLPRTLSNATISTEWYRDHVFALVFLDNLPNNHGVTTYHSPHKKDAVSNILFLPVIFYSPNIWKESRPLKLPFKRAWVWVVASSIESSSLKSRWAWGRRWNSVSKHQELQGWWVGNKNWVVRFENLFIVGLHDI